MRSVLLREGIGERFQPKRVDWVKGLQSALPNDDAAPVSSEPPVP